ncbi:unnamed protein product [Amoebophrya sp. A120]|nr:unnamed protein product [Amoebophrya sp. A120]|eukprot:GSA120T00023394001.1
MTAAGVISSWMPVKNLACVCRRFILGFTLATSGGLTFGGWTGVPLVAAIRHDEGAGTSESNPKQKIVADKAPGKDEEEHKVDKVTDTSEAEKKDKSTKEVVSLSSSGQASSSSSDENAPAESKKSSSSKDDKADLAAGAGKKNEKSDVKKTATSSSTDDHADSTTKTETEDTTAPSTTSASSEEKTDAVDAKDGKKHGGDTASEKREGDDADETKQVASSEEKKSSTSAEGDDDGTMKNEHHSTAAGSDEMSSTSSSHHTPGAAAEELPESSSHDATGSAVDKDDSYDANGGLASDAAGTSASSSSTKTSTEAETGGQAASDTDGKTPENSKKNGMKSSEDSAPSQDAALDGGKKAGQASRAESKNALASEDGGDEQVKQKVGGAAGGSNGAEQDSSGSSSTDKGERGHADGEGSADAGSELEMRARFRWATSSLTGSGTKKAEQSPETHNTQHALQRVASSVGAASAGVMGTMVPNAHDTFDAVKSTVSKAEQRAHNAAQRAAKATQEAVSGGVGQPPGREAGGAGIEEGAEGPEKGEGEDITTPEEARPPAERLGQAISLTAWTSLIHAVSPDSKSTVADGIRLRKAWETKINTELAPALHKLFFPVPPKESAINVCSTWSKSLLRLPGRGDINDVSDFFETQKDDVWKLEEFASHSTGVFVTNVLLAGKEGATARENWGEIGDVRADPEPDFSVHVSKQANTLTISPVIRLRRFRILTSNKPSNPDEQADLTDDMAEEVSEAGSSKTGEEKYTVARDLTTEKKVEQIEAHNEAETSEPEEVELDLVGAYEVAVVFEPISCDGATPPQTQPPGKQAASGSSAATAVTGGHEPALALRCVAALLGKGPRGPVAQERTLAAAELLVAKGCAEEENMGKDATTLPLVYAALHRQAAARRPQDYFSRLGGDVLAAIENNIACATQFTSSERVVDMGARPFVVLVDGLAAIGLPGRSSQSMSKQGLLSVRLVPEQRNVVPTPAAYDEGQRAFIAGYLAFDLRDSRGQSVEFVGKSDAPHWWYLSAGAGQVNADVSTGCNLRNALTARSFAARFKVPDVAQSVREASRLLTQPFLFVHVFTRSGGLRMDVVAENFNGLKSRMISGSEAGGTPDGEVKLAAGDVTASFLLYPEGGPPDAGKSRVRRYKVESLQRAVPGTDGADEAKQRAAQKPAGLFIKTFPKMGGKAFSYSEQKGADDVVEEAIRVEWSQGSQHQEDKSAIANAADEMRRLLRYESPQSVPDNAHGGGNANAFVQLLAEPPRSSSRPAIAKTARLPRTPGRDAHQPPEISPGQSPALRGTDVKDARLTSHGRAPHLFDADGKRINPAIRWYIWPVVLLISFFLYSYCLPVLQSFFVRKWEERQRARDLAEGRVYPFGALAADAGMTEDGNLPKHDKSKNDIHEGNEAGDSTYPHTGDDASVSSETRRLCWRSNYPLRRFTFGSCVMTT